MDENFKRDLKSAHLNYLAENFDTWLDTHKQEKALLSRALRDLVRKELAWKQKRRQARQITGSKVGAFKGMEDFEWDFPKAIDRGKVERIFSPELVSAKENAVIIGPQGVGKTMIAKNVAYRAALAGITVLFTTLSELIADLHTAQKIGVDRQRLKRYVKPKLLVIDEIGYQSFDAKAADWLYAVFQKRYEVSSTIVTTNLLFGEWPVHFAGAGSIKPLIDRFTHRCEVISIDGDSYRSKEAKERSSLKNKTKKENMS